MSSFSWRCLSALVAVLGGSISVARGEGDWTAGFPGPGREHVSAGFAAGDGRHVVTVALSGVEAEVGTLRFAGRKLPTDVFVDPVSRLVIFRVTGPPGQALSLLDAAPPGVGTAIFLPDGRAKGKISGRVKRFGDKILPLALLQVNYEGAVPLPGTPLSDQEGRVLAVAHQSTNDHQGYALPVEVVRRVLDDVQRAGRVSDGWIGIKLRPAVPLPQVTEVQPDSPSARAGIEAGDILLKVGPRPLVEYADAVNAFYFLKPGVATPLRVKRGGREVKLSVVPVEKQAE